MAFFAGSEESAERRSALRGFRDKLSGLREASTRKKQLLGQVKRWAKGATHRTKTDKDYYDDSSDAVFDIRLAGDAFTASDQKNMAPIPEFEQSESSSSEDSSSSESDDAGGTQAKLSIKSLVRCTARMPKVGDAVRHGAWQAREDASWTLAKHEAAVVAEVDADGDLKLQNSAGQVSPHFFNRKYWCFTEAEELVPCTSRDPDVGWRVRASDQKQVQHGNWTLDADETAEIAQVDASSLKFKLRDPRGSTSPLLSRKGFSYVQVLRSCMTEWPAVGSTVRREDWKPVKQGDWMLAPGESATVAQVDSKGFFRLRCTSAGSCGGSSSPEFISRKRFYYVEIGPRPSQQQNAPEDLEFQPRQPEASAKAKKDPQPQTLKLLDAGADSSKQHSSRKADKKDRQLQTLQILDAGADSVGQRSSRKADKKALAVPEGSGGASVAPQPSPRKAKGHDAAHAGDARPVPEKKKKVRRVRKERSGSTAPSEGSKPSLSSKPDSASGRTRTKKKATPAGHPPPLPPPGAGDSSDDNAKF